MHAELERVGEEWALADDGLSRNGSFVNGERVAGRRRLDDGDALRFGDTPVLYRAPSEVGMEETLAAKDRRDLASLTETQRRVLVALCRPVRRRERVRDARPPIAGSPRRSPQRRRGEGEPARPVREVRNRGTCRRTRSGSGLPSWRCEAAAITPAVAVRS